MVHRERRKAMLSQHSKPEILLVVVFMCMYCFKQTDAQNNYPTITGFSPSSPVIIPEDTPVGTSVTTINWSDPDDPLTPNGTINCYIRFSEDAGDGGNKARHFSIDANTCEVFIAKPLNYEGYRTYDLICRAEDAAGNFSNGRLTVTVTDVNDVEPICQSNTVVGALTEDTPAGTTFASLNCSDPDTGAGGMLQYRVLLGGDTSEIDVNNNGDLSLKRTIDYDTEKHLYSVIVEVADMGTPALSSTVTALLSVEDVDDLAPVYSSPSYTQSVDENIPIGTTVLTLITTDGDAPGTAATEVKYELVGGSCTPDLFEIDRFTGDLILKDNLDYETTPRVDCQVLAWSSTNKAQGNIATVTITVNDLDDEAPVFSMPFYQVSVSEWTTKGQFVAQVDATDPDGGAVVYSIEPGLFDIDPSTGTVTLLNDTIDYETATAYLVRVNVTDSGTPPQESSVLLQILIEPENEFKPVFVGTLSTSIPEDTAPGTSVLLASAQDPDAGLDGDLHYELLTTGVPFLVDASLGVVRVASNLDYEKQRLYELIIQASDNSTTQQFTASETYTVSIEDVNDLAIMCDPPDTAVVENPFPLNNVVTTISCTDLDVLPTTLNFTVTSGNGEGAFELNPTTGEIKLLSIPLANVYTLEIMVSDGVDTVDTSIIILAEQVLQFVNLPDNLTITEEGAGQTLITVDACCAFPEIQYTLLSGNGDGRVVLSSTSGELRLTVPYDREVQDTYLYEISATSDSGQTATGVLSVTVMDINDSGPEFAASLYHATVDESLAVNTVISQYMATDADAGVNAALTYTIISGDPGGQFAVDSTGQLSVAALLDYETQQSYTLVITAVDGGTPALTGTTEVLITVQNHDEFPPVIVPMPGPFSASLMEDVALGTSVFQVTAQDGDAGSNFTYAIESGNTDNDFAIDPTSGFIWVAKFLDRERTDTYSLSLTATNQNGQTVSTILDITIDDVNDNDPAFSESLYIFNVAHQDASGTLVGTINVIDADTGVNGQVDVVIESGNTGGAFALNGMNIETQIVMDYQNVNRYLMVFKATDQGTPTRTGTTVVLVNVLPPTDVTPEYAVNTDTITLSEDESVGTQVYDVDATNLGALEDGSIVYSITSGNTNNDFIVRSKTGEVVISNALDYETTQVYTLEITASNTAGTETDVFTLTVNIGNVNDHYPVFIQGSYSFTVDEGESYNFPVGTILATDDDLGSFGVVTETLTGSSDFAIVQDTGVIHVRSVLDYLRQNIYFYTLTATDGGAPNAKTAQVSVLILINDLNNHAPEFTSGPNAEIPDSAPIDSEVFRVYATDLDTGNAGNVSYKVITDPSGGKFALGLYSGLLTTKSLLDAMAEPSYILTIEASDAGSPVKTSTMSLTITVIATNPNYNDPVFIFSSPQSVIVNRDEPTGYTVLSAEATDDDYGLSGEIYYRITSGNDDGYFIIDSNTGDITTAATLLEAEDTYSLTVVATDRGTPSRSATLIVDITINPPATTSITSDYVFTANEDAAIGDVIGNIPADPPRVVSGYTIVSGNLDNAFSIAASGDITVSNALDYETFPVYSLLTDVTTDIGTFTKVVQINLVDLNDSPPVFDVMTLTLDVPENTPAGTTVATLSYTDDDSSPANRDNTLSLASPGPTLFDIDQDGHLILNSVPDYETTPSITFNAEVTENQAPGTTNTMTVTVNIIDIEETEVRSPSTVTDNALISLEVYYQAPIGHVIHTLIPGDFGMTSSATSVVEFISYDTTDPFSINPATGDLTVSGTLEDETTYFHWVTCKVVEGGVTTVEAALLRIDTFDRNKYIVVIEFAESVDTVEDNLYYFQQRTQAFFTDPQRVGFTDVFAIGTVARRRLLAETTAAYTYVVADSSVDEMKNVNQPKTFLTEQQMLDVLQSNPDGTPVTGLSDSSGGMEVSQVEPFQETETSDSGIEDFATSTSGIVVFTLLGLLLLAAIVLTVVCLLHRKNQKGEKEDKDRNAREERERY